MTAAAVTFAFAAVAYYAGHHVGDYLLIAALPVSASVRVSLGEAI